MSFDRAEVLNSFRRQGLRCTSQRYAVLECLAKRPCHPTADEIYEWINRTDPRASRATVYRNLHSLIQAGLIHEVKLKGHASRFEFHTERHHHFVCERCGRIEDLEWFDVPDLVRKAKLPSRTVRTWELILRGVCQQCSSR